jgi:hypothetical protein
VEIPAKENDMDHMTKTQLMAGAFFLIVCIILGIRALLRYLRRDSAPFRDYFGPEYDNDMLQHSALSESEEWRVDRHSGFMPFRIRNPGAKDRR